MHVLLLNDTIEFAGTERHLIDLAFGLSLEGLDIAIACPQKSVLWERAAVAGISLHHLDYRGLFDLGAVRRLSALIAEHRIDVVHAHNGKTAWLGALASLDRSDFRLVFTQHFLEPAHTKKGGLRKRIWGAAHRWVDRRISHFIAISDAVREQMVARKVASPAKMSVVANGIPAPNVGRLKESSEIRRQLDVEMNGPLVVCVARLEPEKNCASLVRAMAIVKGSLPQARCAIVGDGSELGLLRRLVAELDLNGSVHLVGFQPDAYSWIRSADLLVLVSIAEPFGLVLLEAMAFGKPVVAARAGGPVEIVDDGVTGILTPPFDPVALAGAMLSILKDPERARRMGAAGRAKYERCFTAERMARETLDIYRSCLSR